MKRNTASTSEHYNNPVGSASQKPSKKADKAIRNLIETYNSRNSGQQVDPSLTALIMVIIRLHDSVRSDPNFRGGYNELARVVRRHLFNHLNLSVLYKDEGSDIDSENSGE